MLAEFAPRAGAEPRAASPALLGDDKIDRPVAADVQDVIVAAEIGVGLAVLNVRAVAADAGEYRFAARRVARHFARQSEQLERLFKRYIVSAQSLRQRGTLGLLALPLLDVFAKAPVAQSDLFAGRGILAEHPDAWPIALGGLRARRRKNPRVLTLWIARAADEGAVFAELQRQLSLAAEWAKARIDPVATAGKNMRTQKLVQTVEHLPGAEVLDVADGAGEIIPEVAQ